MTFTPLQIGETRHRITSDELSLHEIDLYGNSSRSDYEGSIFSVIEHTLSHKGNDSHRQSTITDYTITRIRKEDLEFDVNTPVILSAYQVSAMRIKKDGFSDIPSLKDYQFTYKILNNGNYSVTKHLLNPPR